MKIASFNAQRFGLKKALDPGVLSTLIKVKVKAVSWTAASCLDHKDKKCLTEIFAVTQKGAKTMCQVWKQFVELLRLSSLVFCRSCPDTI